MQRLMLALFLLFSVAIVARGITGSENIRIAFVPFMGADSLHTGKEYRLKNSTVRISKFKWYVSGIRLFRAHTLVYTDTPGYHLLDIGAGEDMIVSLAAPTQLQFDSLAFNVGIDSATNVAGAIGGDLDPTKGMYWTWQSGYINMKIEGETPLSADRRQEFQLHIGGYSEPHASLRTLGFAVRQSANIMIATDLQYLLDVTDFSVDHHIMVPGQAAAAYATKAASMFRVLP